MSLVYAAKLNTLTFFLSDTFSEISTSKTKFNWFSDPLIKVISIADCYVLAYAGNSHYASLAVDALFQKVVDPIEVLLKIHSESFLNGEYSADFIVYICETKELIFIKSGFVEKKSFGYIGNKNGFEKFQKYFLEGVDFSPGAGISILRMPDKASDDDQNAYSKRFSAFKCALENSDDAYGGYIVPYTVEDGRLLYGTYREAFRINFEQKVLNLGWLPVDFQGIENGGFIIEFAGSKGGFSSYYPLGKSGHIYRGYYEAKFDNYDKYNNIEALDFYHLAADVGIKEAIKSYVPWQAKIRKAHKNISSSDWQRADRLINEIIEEILLAISKKNNGWIPDFSKGVTSGLHNEEGFNVDLNILNIITALLEVNQHLWHKRCDQEKYELATAEIEKWRQGLEAMLFHVKIDSGIILPKA